jgi:hypothetical protein
MSPDPTLRRVHACALANVPAYMHGAPGTGKTSRMRLYTRVLTLHLERWLLSRCEPIDLKPRIISEGRVVVCDPPEIERLMQTAKAAMAAKDGRPFWGVMFMDELNLATRETENAALDRMDAPPEGIVVIAAGNPPTRGQAARSLGAAAANRFCHLFVTADADAFARAQVQGWPDDPGSFPIPDPATLATATGKYRMLVSSFIKRRPELLEVQPDNPVDAGKGWPSTRTWEYAVKVYAVAVSLGYDTEDRKALLAGLLGDGAAVEFLAYCEDADLVDPEAWLADPTSVTPDPNRVDRTVAALTSVVHSVQTKLTEARWTAAWQILAHIITTDANGMAGAMVGGDLLVAMFRDLAKRTPEAIKALTPPHKLMGKYTPRMAALLAT